MSESPFKPLPHKMFTGVMLKNKQYPPRAGLNKGSAVLIRKDGSRYLAQRQDTANTHLWFRVRLKDFQIDVDSHPSL